jgi:hypothetical protein
MGRTNDATRRPLRGLSDAGRWPAVVIRSRQRSLVEVPSGTRTSRDALSALPNERQRRRQDGVGLHAPAQALWQSRIRCCSPHASGPARMRQGVLAGPCVTSPARSRVNETGSACPHWPHRRPHPGLLAGGIATTVLRGTLHRRPQPELEAPEALRPACSTSAALLRHPTVAGFAGRRVVTGTSGTGERPTPPSGQRDRRVFADIGHRAGGRRRPRLRLRASMFHLVRSTGISFCAAIGFWGLKFEVSGASAAFSARCALA